MFCFPPNSTSFPYHCCYVFSNIDTGGFVIKATVLHGLDITNSINIYEVGRPFSVPLQFCALARKRNWYGGCARRWVALGDRFCSFIQTLNNDKKPFNSIFNSKRKSNYSFKKFIHSKTIQNYSFKEFIHSKKIQNYSFKEFIHSNWKKLFKIRSKIC